MGLGESLGTKEALPYELCIASAEKVCACDWLKVNAFLFGQSVVTTVYISFFFSFFRSGVLYTTVCTEET